MGGMALASDGPTEVKNWFKTWATDWLCGREEAPGSVFWIIGMELSAEFLPITLLIVFQVSLGVWSSRTAGFCRNWV